MKRIVRLTEKDLTRLVNRVIKEQQMVNEFFFDDEDDASKMSDGTPMKKSKNDWAINLPAKKGPFAHHDLVGGWRDKDDLGVDEPTDYSEEMSFGPEDYDQFMEFINDCDTTWCLKTKKMYKRYADKGDITVRR